MYGNMFFIIQGPIQVRSDPAKTKRGNKGTLVTFPIAVKMCVEYGVVVVPRWMGDGRQGPLT